MVHSPLSLLLAPSSQASSGAQSSSVRFRESWSHVASWPSWQEVALTVTNAAGIYVRNCGFRAKLNTSSPDNAAVVISNAFEVFFEVTTGPTEAVLSVRRWRREHRAN